MYKWEIKSKKDKKTLSSSQIVKVILTQRGLKTQKEIDQFLTPSLKAITAKSLGIEEKNVSLTIKRIKKAIKNKEQILVYGDYDVDGVCGAAILWESLSAIGANVMPYIPHRIEEGYGLSKVGIDNLIHKFKDTKLIVTVDNGIVATDAVDYANEKEIDVIITDHHLPAEKLPKAYSVFHTTKICGAAVAWVLSCELDKSNFNRRLDLVALATVADLMPLRNENRTLLMFGLDELRKTTRFGLIELFKEAAIDPSKINTYEIGHIIAPRLNAMGRLEHAIDSLRLICTKSPQRAKELALKLGSTNRQRQLLTQQLFQHARDAVSKTSVRKNLIFLYHETYQPGVIGLIAGRLVEEFYRPAIVINKGEIYSKASARSVSGFNIVEFIREARDMLVDVGGHPMAAGFTLETLKIEQLEQHLDKLANKMIKPANLKKVIKVDLEIPLSVVSVDLYNELQKLSPFGMANPEPTFLSRNVEIGNIQIVGIEKKHVRLLLVDENGVSYEAIAFGWGEKAGDLKVGSSIDAVYTIEQREWKGNKNLRLKIKDIKT